MLIVIILSILIAGFMYANVFYDNYDMEVLTMIGSVVSGFLLFIAIITIPISRMEVKSEIRKFNQTISTIAIARKNAGEIERAALQHDIIEKNNWLQNQRYWNETIWDIYIPDKVMKLKFMK